MNLADCYQLLELRAGASFAEIKASYRRLARQYHPDLNPNQQAAVKFIAITEAYKLLLGFVQQSQTQEPTTPERQNKATVRQQSGGTKVRRKDKIPPLSEIEQKLK